MLAEAIQGTPEATIKQNVFHLQLKLQLGVIVQEIVALQEAKASQKKEFNELKGEI